MVRSVVQNSSQTRLLRGSKSGCRWALGRTTWGNKTNPTSNAAREIQTSYRTTSILRPSLLRPADVPRMPRQFLQIAECNLEHQCDGAFDTRKCTSLRRICLSPPTDCVYMGAQTAHFPRYLPFHYHQMPLISITSLYSWYQRRAGCVITLRTADFRALCLLFPQSPSFCSPGGQLTHDLQPRHINLLGVRAGVLAIASQAWI